MRAHLSYANVVASLALFLALGGGAYAAVKLSPSSVRSVHIRNGEVKSADVADGSIAARDLKKGLIPGVVTGIGTTGAAGTSGAAGATGPQGPSGPTGPGGPAGPAGPAGATGAQGSQGVAGPAGPAGSAVIASRTSGTVTAGPNPGQFGNPVTVLTWTQPPGTVDELRGTVRLNYPASCTDLGEGIDIIVRDQDGREISPESPTDDNPVANGGVTAGETTTGVRYLIGETIDEAAQDTIGFPVEDGVWLNPGSQPANRSVTMTVAAVGAGCGAPTVSLTEAFVVRSTP